MSESEPVTSSPYAQDNPIRLSHSTLELIHSCERKFQIEKLLVNDGREESEHLVFGTAYGIGVATYLETQDHDLALFKAWMAYDPLIEYGNKTEASCLLALEASFSKLDDLLQDYELVYFQQRPATELSFRLEINPLMYFVGYIDAVIRNRWTGKYFIFECKHTGLGLSDLSPLYKHSGQALGYSIVLDRIVGEDQSAYGVLYFVCQLGRTFGDFTVHLLPFDKNLMDRLNWFITLGLDAKHVEELRGFKVYPRRGSSCLRFNKPCFHFGTCHMHTQDTPKLYEPDTIEYQFTYRLDELVANHLIRLGA
jgi:hypothetical protein